MLKKFSPAVFLLTIFCFFLPWVSVSCQNQKVATFSGTELIVGKTVKVPDNQGNIKEERTGSEPLAILALLSALAGLGLSFLKDKRGVIGSGVAGALGIVFLFLLKSKLENDAMNEGSGLLNVHYEIGFYLTMLLFLIAVILSVVIFMSESKQNNMQQSQM
ncbi:hypothetical protein [Sulfurihydrogenibium sp.]|uniref:hypothetical protein n=1 Tax=Sulfurihydrogenibium sp. TaxID=2053621 RepID=UPI003D09665B